MELPVKVAKGKTPTFRVRGQRKSQKNDGEDSDAQEIDGT